MQNQIISSAKILGQAIKAFRERKGLTQRELAILVGVKQSTVSNIETASGDVRLSTLFRLMSALEADMTFSERKKHSNQDAW